MNTRIVGAKYLSAREIEEYVRKHINKGLDAAAKFVVKQLRVTTGVQATLRRTKRGWVAKVKATPGAPPRRVTGKGQKSIDYRQTENSVIFSAIYYMLYWEGHGHPWMRKTIERLTPQIGKIVSGTK